MSTKPAEPPAQFTCAQVSTDDDGPTKITVTWPAPGEDGGSAVTGFLVQVASDDDDNAALSGSATWSDAPMGLLDADARSYTYDPKGDDALTAGSVRWFRVIVLNSVNTNDEGDIIRDSDGNIDVNHADVDLVSVCSRIMGDTAVAGTPGQPDGLVVEPARDAGSVDPDNPVPNSERGVLLLWNAPDDPAGDTVTGYVIARRVRDDSSSAWGAWETDWAEIEETATSYTDRDIVAELDNGEARQYRVSAQSGSGTGDPTAVITYPHAEAMHGAVVTELMAPTNVMAADVTTDPDNLMIEVTWTPGENADGGHLVLLFTSDFDDVTVGTPTEEGTYTFSNVDADTYVAVVVSIKTRSEYLYDAGGPITVGQ
jgi:hypothetical protein